jgi:transcriptional regulator with XRE-family HTH domain
METTTTSGGESPLIARRRVRLALREAREALGLTQSEVAEAMEWSLSKVIRIENGDVSISPNDLRPLMGHLGLKDRAVADALLQDAKASRTRKQQFWWQDPALKNHLTENTQRLIAFEREAVAARYFAIYNVPGVLQSRSFAQAVLKSWQFGLSEEDVKIRLEVRMRRREEMLTRAKPIKLSVLLDEAVVWRPYGGRAVLIEQLSELNRLVEAGRVDLRIVPFTVEAPLPTYGSYDILYLSEDGDDENAVVYRELDFFDEIVEDRARAAQYRARFDELWNASMDEASTIGLIQRRLSNLTSGDEPQTP